MTDDRLPSDPSFDPPHLNDKIANPYRLQRDCMERKFGRNFSYFMKRLWNRTHGYQWSSLHVVDLQTGMTVYELNRDASKTAPGTLAAQRAYSQAVAIRDGHLVVCGQRVSVGIDRTDYGPTGSNRAPAGIIVRLHDSPSSPVDHSRISETAWPTGRLSVLAASGITKTDALGHQESKGLGIAMAPTGGVHYATWRETTHDRVEAVLGRFDSLGRMTGYAILDDADVPLGGRLHALVADDDGVLVAGGSTILPPRLRIGRYDNDLSFVGAAEVTVTGPSYGASGPPVGESYPVLHAAIAEHPATGTLTAANGGATYWGQTWYDPNSTESERTLYDDDLYSWSVRRYDSRLHVVAQNTVADATQQRAFAVAVSPSLGATLAVEGPEWTVNIYSHDLSSILGSYTLDLLDKPGVGTPDFVVNALAIDDDGNVYYGSSSHAHKRAPNGDLIWSTPFLPNVAVSSGGTTNHVAIVQQSGIVVFAGFYSERFGGGRATSASLAAYRMDNGEQLWVRSLGERAIYTEAPEEDQPVRDWRFNHHTAVTAWHVAVADDGRHAYVCTDAGISPVGHHSRSLGSRICTSRQE
jgi:hypothetical protein